MAKRRTLKRNIEVICSELLAECIAISLYESKAKAEQVESLLYSIVKIESHYISRVSHIQPGLSAKAYFKDLVAKFTDDVNEIVDHINNMH